MEAITNFFGWLFSTKMGVVCLLAGGVVICFIVAWALERRTRKEFYNHEKNPDDLSLFDDE